MVSLVEMEGLQQPEEIKLRKISSLEISPLFESLDEKIAALKGKSPERNTLLPIPVYPKSRHYKNSLVKSLLTRGRYFFAILKQRLSGKDYPLICVIVVNNHCNWNCTYCFGDYPNRREVDYTTDELKYLIESLHRMGVRYVNLHGGETLLRKDVGELVSFCKNLGLYVSIVTNGSLLKQKLEDVRQVDNLTVSLDGRKENNDKVRGEGTFDISLEAIRMAVRERIPLRVSATLTKYTKRDVGYLSQLAKDEGFHLYFSILFKPMKQAQDAQMSVEEIRKAIDEIRRYKKMGFPIVTSELALNASYEWPFDYNSTHHVNQAEIPESYKKHQVKCYYSKTNFTIEADGYVYPCFLTTDGSFAPINWKEVGVEEAIENVKRKNLCRACPAMSHNDHSALLGLNLRQVGYILKDQLKEVFRY